MYGFWYTRFWYTRFYYIINDWNHLKKWKEKEIEINSTKNYKY